MHEDVFPLLGQAMYTVYRGAVYAPTKQLDALAGAAGADQKLADLKITDVGLQLHIPHETFPDQNWLHRARRKTSLGVSRYAR